MTRDLAAGTHPHPLHARKTTSAVRLAIVAGYTDGKSMAALGREHGLSQKTVKRILIDAGVELRFDPLRGKPFSGDRW